MKFLLLLAVGAFAAQDVTPPVISLSLFDHAAEVTARSWHGTSAASVACIVGSSLNECEDPQCSVTDHHDAGLDCDPPIITRVRHMMTTVKVSSTTSSTKTSVDRTELGQWLLEYRARDNSNNEAEAVTFSFVFVDPYVPKVSFNLAEAQVGYSNDVNAYPVPNYNVKGIMGATHGTDLDTFTGDNAWGGVFSSRRPGSIPTEPQEPSRSFVFRGMQSSSTLVTSAAGTQTSSNNLEAGECGRAYGHWAAIGCSRTAETAKWAFDATGIVNDNYRSSSEMTLVYSMDGTTWTSASSTPSICMTSTTTHTIQWYFHDYALAYGFQHKSNPQVHRLELTVTDNTAPRIFCYSDQGTFISQRTNVFTRVVQGSYERVRTQSILAEKCAKTTLECGTTATGTTHVYTEYGFEIEDNVDGWSCSDGFTAPRCLVSGAQCYISGTIDQSMDSLDQIQTITYGYTDAASNTAPKVVREVVTRDTQHPVLTMQGDCTLENSAGTHINDGGTGDADSSNGGLFDHNRLADLFTHRDDCDKTIVTTVTMHEGACVAQASDNVNKCGGTAPASSMISGTYLVKYTWDGTENSRVGSNAANRVRGTQQFPEYESGTYSLQYTTVDHKQFTETACRTIQNVDHTHPIIQILGSDVMTLEATHQGNYIDDGATCSDQVDGVISQNVEVSGDVVNLSKVGLYTITYNCKDSANNAAPAATRTVEVAQTSCPKCTVHGDDEVDHEASFAYVDASASCSDVIDGSVTLHCSSQAGAITACGPSLVDYETTGKYIITYRAQNTVSLWNDGANCRGGANHYYRTVFVSDTLKPVVTLKYDNKIIAQGSRNSAGNAYIRSDNVKTYRENKKTDGDDAGAPGPFGDAGGAHPSYMAEQTSSSVNGWVLGAIASAVAGLALLGYSTRKTAVATSVPV
jgi:hypothetical protein